MGPLDSIFGATLCGTVASAWLLGLLSVLSYQYYVNFPKDPLGTKVLVGFLWFLQVFNQVVITKMSYYYLVSSFGDSTVLNFDTWEWSAFIGIETVTATCVQLYYARRVFLLNNSHITGAVVVILSLCQLAFGLGTMGVTIRVHAFADFIPWTWISLCWLSCSLACDFFISVSQVWFLVRHKTGMSRTDRVLKMLIVYIVSTGMLTSVIAALEIGTFAALGFNFVHVFLSYPNGGVYSLSLLSNLDIRRKIRESEKIPMATHEIQTMHFRKPDSALMETGSSSGNSIAFTKQVSIHP